MKSFAALGCLALAGLASAAPERMEKQSVTKRDGPKGQVVTPTYQQTFQYANNDPGMINVVYNTAQNYASSATTLGIDVTLESLDGTVSYTLANGFNNGDEYSNKQIVGNFVVPSGFCGTYRLAIGESQIYNGGYIRFRAYAPEINIWCHA